MSQNGKGDTPRPLSVDKEEFDKRYEAIFGRQEKPIIQSPQSLPPERPQSDQAS